MLARITSTHLRLCGVTSPIVFSSTRSIQTSSSPSTPVFRKTDSTTRSQHTTNLTHQATSKMSTATTSHSSASLLSLLANRRSHYNLNSDSPLPSSQIESILSSILLTVPSAFNTQATRVVLAVGPYHQKIWGGSGIVTSVLRSHMGEERWSTGPTAKKIAGFAAAYGTVLFFEDAELVGGQKEKFSSYASHFDAWTDQASGMHQLAVWVALEAEGFGANLQHYNPIIDGEIKKVFEVPEGWVLKSQLVFGGIEGGRPDEKPKLKTEETLKVFGAEGEGKI